MIEFDALVLPDPDLDATVAMVRLAEEHGFGNVWVGDSPPLLWPDVYVTLALAAQATSSVNLGTGVTNPVTRHSSVTAAAISTIGRLAPGRTKLGIGLGYSAVQAAGLPPATRKDLTEYVTAVRRILDDSGQDVPVYVAASGPRSLATAGEIGDGVIISVGTHPALIRNAVERIAIGAQRAGSTIDHIEIVALCGIAISDDPEEVRREAAPAAARRALDVRYYPDFLPTELEHLRSDAERVAEAYDVHSHTTATGVKHNELVTDALLDAYTIAGSAEQCVDRIRRMEGSGVDRIALYPVGERRHEALSRFGRQVLPVLRGGGA